MMFGDAHYEFGLTGLNAFNAILMVFQSRYCSAGLWIVSIQFSWVGNNLQTLVYLLCFVLETYLKVVHFRDCKA